MSECPYCVNSFEMNDTCADEFRMWQGLVGPYYIPAVSQNGILSWTNTGELPNPDEVNIKGEPGAGLEISGFVDAASDLPATADEYTVFLVGTASPYYGYIYADGGWTNIGEIGKGETGEGVPTGGTAGQVLAKASGTNYDTEWITPGAGVDPATAAPLMDGTAAVGTATKYAREDHVHPSDTSRASVSDLAIAVLQAAVQTISANGTTSNIALTGLTGDHVIGSWGMFSDANCTTPIPGNSPTCDITITTDTNKWSVTIANFTSTFYLRPTFILKQN